MRLIQGGLSTPGPKVRQVVIWSTDPKETNCRTVVEYDEGTGMVELRDEEVPFSGTVCLRKPEIYDKLSFNTDQARAVLRALKDLLGEEEAEPAPSKASPKAVPPPKETAEMRRAKVREQKERAMAETKERLLRSRSRTTT